MVRSEYEARYKITLSVPPIASVAKHKTLLDSLPILRARAAVTPQDELDIYLGSDTEETDDPIGWWIDNAYRFPTLSRMALDYLNIPGKFIH
jgi:hypothetical protein